jgi:hypothetical protein
MIQYLESLPTPLLGLLFCGVAVGLTTIAQVLLHRRWPMDARRPLNEVTGFVIAVVGVVYAVLLASIAILAIERYDKAQDIAEAEAGIAGDIYRDLAGFPEPVRSELRSIMADYVSTVVDIEWDLMAREIPSERGWQNHGWRDLETLLGRVATFEPTTQGEMAFLQEILSQSNALIDARRARMFLVHNPVDQVIWWVVIIGGVSTIGLALLFGVASAPGHLVVSNVLAFSIGLVLLLIFVMDRPFSGASRVTSEPFGYVQEQMQRQIEGGT